MNWHIATVQVFSGQGWSGQKTSWHVAVQAPGSTNSGLFDGGFSWGLLLIGIVAVLALTAVCTFGILARMRDRAADRKSLEAFRRSVGVTETSVETVTDKGGDQRRTA